MVRNFRRVLDRLSLAFMVVKGSMAFEFRPVDFSFSFGGELGKQFLAHFLAHWKAC